MKTLNELVSWDAFFFHGTGNLSDEIGAEVYTTLFQDRGSMFYFRQYGSAIRAQENQPNALVLQVILRYEVVTSIAYTNTVVSAGENGNPDRRIAVSQNSIEFTQSGQDLDVDVYYIPFNQTLSVGKVVLPMAGG